LTRLSGCLKGCALGCGGLFLLGMLVVGGFLLSVRSLANRAVDLRQSLESTLPDQQSFTPRLDGTIPPDRLERFLEVRWQLMTFCPQFTELAAGMSEMDDHVAELESNPDATPRDLLGLFGRVGGIGRGMLGVGRWLGEFSVARNEALLAQEMGLGEYTWIYVITFYSWLGHEPASFALAEGEQPRIFQERILGDVREMLRRQLGEVETEVGESNGRATSEASARLRALRLEVEAMDEDASRLPFADGLPATLVGSLEARRQELEGAYCAATSELDFMRTERVGLKHDHL